MQTTWVEEKRGRLIASQGPEQPYHGTSRGGVEGKTERVANVRNSSWERERDDVQYYRLPTATVKSSKDNRQSQKGKKAVTAKRMHLTTGCSKKVGYGTERLSKKRQPWQARDSP